jgi:flagellin
MSLRINTNVASLNGQRNLANNEAMVNQSLQRLSSGLQINSAADNPAGLIISEQMKAQLGGISQAISNSQQAVSMVQTAEGALDEVSTLLNKARSLAVHAANQGVNDSSQLVADQGELDNIVDSISRISDTTQFGTKKILDGTLSNGVSNSSSIASVKLGGDYTTKLTAGNATRGYGTLQITQSATQATDTLTLGANVFKSASGATKTLATASGSAVLQQSFNISINGQTVSFNSGTTKNQIIQQLNSIGQNIGFTAGTVSGTKQTGDIKLTARDYGSSFSFDVQFVSGTTGASQLTTASHSGVDLQGKLYLYTGANGTNGTAVSGSSQTITLNKGKGLTLQSSGGTVILATTNLTNSGTQKGFIYGAINATTAGATFQIGANANQTATVNLQSVNSSQLGIGGSGTYNNLLALKGSSLISGNANEALKVIDKSIADITSIRGNLGAFQANTLETNINSLSVTQENLTSAESTITDVDFAAESANFTKYNILVQSSTAMLAQANQLPQGVLKLLG